MSSPSVLRQLQKEVGDLLAKHEQQGKRQDYTAYRNDPVGFMRDVLKADPWSKQQEMAHRVRDNRRVIVVTGNGLGKDWVTARIALWWVYARRGMVILTGPTERQVKQILMREIRMAFARAPELPGELYQLELRVDNESGILAFTSDNADKLVGFHAERLLICLTEGQGVAEEAYEAAFACCTAPENHILCYGNPTNPTGPFYRAANNDGWNRLTIAATEHPNVVSGRAEIPGAVSREWIDTIRDEYGEGSSVYRARVLAEFPEDSIEGLIKREWLREAFKKWESGELLEAARRRLPLLSLDVARFGPDATALAVVRGPIVSEIVTWRGLPITDTVSRTIDHSVKVMRGVFDESFSIAPATWRPLVIVDEPGLGGGAIDILKARPWPVEPFNGGREPRDKRRFFNVRSETHWAFRSLLERGQVALPRDTVLEEEALAIEWQTNTRGQIQVLSKDTVRAALGRSPDRLDAVIMGLCKSMNAVARPTVRFVGALNV